MIVAAIGTAIALDQFSKCREHIYDHLKSC
jgi:hypothetical protein